MWRGRTELEADKDFDVESDSAVDRAGQSLDWGEKLSAGAVDLVHDDHEPQADSVGEAHSGDAKQDEDNGTIGDSVVAGSEHGSGNPDNRRQAGPDDVPSYAPTDPGWSTDDFSSLDLGEDVDSSPRPVRRLDLPPLADATLFDGEQSSSPAGTGGSELSPTGDQANDLGVFGAGDNVADDVGEYTVSGINQLGSNAAEGVGDNVGASPPGQTQLSSEPSAVPKQGVPPHPLSGGGSDMAGLSDDRNQLRSVPAAPNQMGSDPDPFGGYATAERGFEEQFSHNDALGPQSRGDQGGRSNLELAPGLAVAQQKRSWTLPAIGLLAVLGLAAGYFLFVRDGSDSTDTFASEETDPASDLVEEDLEPEGAATDAAAGTVTELSDNPLLTLSGAAAGPLQTETEYEMAIDGVPAGAEYLVVVDDLPQEPALTYLPVLILPEGRHSLRVDVTAGGKTASTNPVDVYVLAPSLMSTYRANLSSVSIADEGWAEALRQFDEFRAAGHEGLILSPSDPYPSLLPGYWNLYIPGFADSAEAQAYCEGAGLAIPDECFPAPFDPNAPPRDG